MGPLHHRSQSREIEPVSKCQNRHWPRACHLPGRNAPQHWLARHSPGLFARRNGNCIYQKRRGQHQPLHPRHRGRHHSLPHILRRRLTGRHSALVARWIANRILALPKRHLAGHRHHSHNRWRLHGARCLPRNRPRSMLDTRWLILRICL